MKVPKGRGSKAGKRRRARFIEDIEHLPAALTIPEFADLMNTTRQHIWHMVKTGKIPTTTPLGRVLRIARPVAIAIYNGTLPAAE
jgi:excisionase family DNA binding protein